MTSESKPEPEKLRFDHEVAKTSQEFLDLLVEDTPELMAAAVIFAWDVPNPEGLSIGAWKQSGENVTLEHIYRTLNQCSAMSNWLMSLGIGTLRDFERHVAERAKASQDQEGAEKEEVAAK